MAGEVSTWVASASCFVARVCRDLRIAEILNRMLRWDKKQCKVSPGTRIVALIVNILVHRRPLYLVREFYEAMDLSVLFDEPVSAADLNDDALGRALDRLYEANSQLCFQTIAATAITRGHLEVRSVHADTTSVPLYGEFEPTKGDLAFQEAHPDRPLLEITYGHSKQHRPDLKQFLYGLVVSKEGVPLLGDVNNGNMSDKTWNRQTIDEIKTSMLDPKRLIDVADSVLITEDNLEDMAKAHMRFISRLPETYKLAHELKERAWESGRWQEIGPLRGGPEAARYATQSFQTTLYGRSYRFLVVRSSSLDKRKMKKIERMVGKERLSLEKEAAQLARQRFACEADARQALCRFLEAHRGVLHRLTGDIHAEETVRRPPGRPRKDVTSPVEITYTVQVRVDAPVPRVLQELRERESTFVLITTLPEDEWSDAAVLHEYKEQQSVEQRFRFLRQPVLVDGIYVKSSRRAEALAYVFLMALFVAAFIEMKIRRELQRTRSCVELPGKRLTNRSTIRAILDVLSTIQVVRIQTDQGVIRTLPSNTDRRALRILELAGYNSAIYTQPCTEAVC